MFLFSLLCAIQIPASGRWRTYVVGCSTRRVSAIWNQYNWSAFTLKAAFWPRWRKKSSAHALPRVEKFFTLNCSFGDQLGTSEQQWQCHHHRHPTWTKLRHYKLQQFQPFKSTSLARTWATRCPAGSTTHRTTCNHINHSSNSSSSSPHQATCCLSIIICWPFPVRCLPHLSAAPSRLIRITLTRARKEISLLNVSSPWII